MNKSTLISWASLMAAFLKAEGIDGIGQNPVFTFTNHPQEARDFQSRFIQYYQEHKNDISLITEIKSKATRNYQELKNFLKNNKLNYKSISPYRPDSVGIATLLEIISPWKILPEITSLSSESVNYKAICFDSGNIEILKNGKHPPIFKIPLRNGDYVVVSVELFPRSVTGVGDSMDLNHQFMNLYKNSEIDRSSEYKGVVIPYVSIDCNFNMGWLLNLQIGAKGQQPFFVSQATHQNILTLNRDGIMARGASVVVLDRSCADTEHFYTINKPFLFAIMRPRVETPLFVGYFMQDSWIKK